MNILQKRGSYLELSEKYHDDETAIIELLEQINKFRSKSQIGDVLMLNDPKKGLFRRSIIS